MNDFNSFHIQSLITDDRQCAKTLRTICTNTNHLSHYFLSTEIAEEYQDWFNLSTNFFIKDGKRTHYYVIRVATVLMPIISKPDFWYKVVIVT